MPLHSADEDDEEEDVAKSIRKLPRNVQRAIDDLISAERGVNVTDKPVLGINLEECLGTKQRDRMVAEPSSSQLPSKRTLGDDDNSDYPESDEEEEDDEVISEERLAKTKGGPLIPLMIYILEKCPDGLAFPVCPVQPCHTVAIPFSKRFTNKLLDHIDHFAGPVIQPLKERMAQTKDEEEMRRLRQGLKIILMSSRFIY